MLSFISRILAPVILACACSSACVSSRPSIEFTVVPAASPGGPGRTEKIAGRVRGARRKQRIVLFAKSGAWWVQPLGNMPFTAIRQDSTFESQTHLGSNYAALLVDADYSPPINTDALPGVGNGVIAVRAVAGGPADRATDPPAKVINFSGYEWNVRQIPSDGGGVSHSNRASNAWTDGQGHLHLRIAREGNEFSAAEINLTRSLGYGTYTFKVAKTPVLEPGVVFAMFTWDDDDATHREIEMELSQWGDPTIKNSQFVIQPFYVAANVFRYSAPPAALTYTMQWELGRVTLTTAQGEHDEKKIAEHVFTSGVPSPGGETVHLNLYPYGRSRVQQRGGVEVVVEEFAFLP